MLQVIFARFVLSLSEHPLLSIAACWTVPLLCKFMQVYNEADYFIAAACTFWIANIYTYGHIHKCIPDRICFKPLDPLVSSRIKHPQRKSLYIKLDNIPVRRRGMVNFISVEDGLVQRFVTIEGQVPPWNLFDLRIHDIECRCSSLTLRKGGYLSEYRCFQKIKALHVLVILHSGSCSIKNFLYGLSANSF